MLENIGKLIVLAGAFRAEIVVFLVSKINGTLLDPMNWINKICNEDNQIILGTVSLGYKGNKFTQNYNEFNLMPI